MRLAVLDRPLSAMQKLRYAIMRAFLGLVPGPMLALSYRSDFCGKHLAPCFHEGLRQMREWTVAEVEIFAAFVSSLNRCRF